MTSNEWPDDEEGAQLLVPDLPKKRTDNIALAPNEWPDDEGSDSPECAVTDVVKNNVGKPVSTPTNRLRKKMTRNHSKRGHDSDQRDDVAVEIGDKLGKREGHDEIEGDKERGRKDIDKAAEKREENNERTTGGEDRVSPPSGAEIKRALLEQLVLLKAPEMARTMVDEAKSALQQDKDYKSYLMVLAELMIGDVASTTEKQKEKKELALEKLSNSWVVHEQIDDLLRFLAMNILVEGVPTPSNSLQDAWCALTLHPTTYESVCEGLGSSSVIEFKVSTSTNIDKEWYRYTYKVLYNEEAPVTFWSNKESDINHTKKDKEKNTQEDQPTHNSEKSEDIVSSLPPDPELKHAFLQALLLTNAPEMARAMVSEAKCTLNSSNDYTSYRMAVAELWIGDATSPSFVQLLKSSFVDDWTNELLRFLAMSVLISGEPTPSAKVKASLCVLKQYPNTYASVCRALGSSVSELNECVSSTMDKEWYRYTLEAYEVLYNKQAPVTFWSSEEGEINDTQEKMTRQDQLSYEQDVQDIKKKLLQASATSPSQAAEDDMLLLLPSSSPPPDLATKQAILQALVLTDTPEMATAMVNEAKIALSQSKDFRSYRAALADVSFGIKVQMKRLQRSSFVDAWINELLRFLAMCVLISGEPTPSDEVRASWYALKQYPTTYASVCRALGSSSAIKVNQTMSSKIGKEWYLYTLEAYEVLYKEPAPGAFWSSEDNKIGDAQMKTSRQGLPSYTHDAKASNKLVRASAALLPSQTTEDDKPLLRNNVSSPIRKNSLLDKVDSGELQVKDGHGASWTFKNTKKSEDHVEKEARDTERFDDASRQPSYRENVHYYSKRPRDKEYAHGASRQSNDTEHVRDASRQLRTKERVNDAPRRPRGTEHVHALRRSRNTDDVNALRRPRDSGRDRASRRPRITERVHDDSRRRRSSEVRHGFSTYGASQFIDEACDHASRRPRITEHAHDDSRRRRGSEVRRGFSTFGANASQFIDESKKAGDDAMYELRPAITALKKKTQRLYMAFADDITSEISSMFGRCSEESLSLSGSESWSESVSSTSSYDGDFDDADEMGEERFESNALSNVFQSDKLHQSDALYVGRFTSDADYVGRYTSGSGKDGRSSRKLDPLKALRRKKNWSERLRKPNARREEYGDDNENSHLASF